MRVHIPFKAFFYLAGAHLKLGSNPFTDHFTMRRLKRVVHGFLFGQVRFAGSNNGITDWNLTGSDLRCGHVALGSGRIDLRPSW